VEGGYDISCLWSFLAEYLKLAALPDFIRPSSNYPEFECEFELRIMSWSKEMLACRSFPSRRELKKTWLIYIVY
jgi:hypothetical protein